MDIFGASMQDSFRHKGLRNQLIQELKSKEIASAEVLKAMVEVPRHLFCFDSTFLHLAYEDRAFPIGSGQTISQPSTVAFQSTLLKANRRDKILEIGTGSGYQCAVLSAMGLQVFSIERQKLLHDRATILLEKLGYQARCFYGDGFAGKAAFAPFQRILVTCGAPVVPELLKMQLAVGGRMVVPVGEVNKVQTMLSIDRLGADEFVVEEHGLFQFVPMLERTDTAQ